VTSIGACLSDSSSRFTTNDVALESSGFIPVSVLKQFQNEGYKCVRKIDYSKVDGEVRIPFITGEEAPKISKASSSYNLRMTADGFEYVSDHIIPDPKTEIIDGDLRNVESYNPMGNRRALKVIGVDDRTKVADTSVFPYRIIGQLGYGYNTDRWDCTGTVIYKSAILTAAHCVYDRVKNQYAPLTRFAPARIGSGSSFYDPYGYWLMEYIAVKYEYTQSGSSSFQYATSYDYAVVKLKTENTLFPPKFIGDHVGYAGMAEVYGVDDLLLDSSTITGFPGDKPGARTMWTSGQCPNGFIEPSVGFDPKFAAFHDCDTYGGQSGSSIFVRIYGIGYV
jgi:V8-like Glu-specific endopeptidase